MALYTLAAQAVINQDWLIDWVGDIFFHCPECLLYSVAVFALQQFLGE